jgi:hypothetical protein
VLAVFDLGFGERGLIVRAPVDRLETFVDGAGGEEAAEGVGDVGFVVEGHRGVGMVPVAEDAEADEVFTLDVDVLRGELAARAPDLGGRHLGAFGAELLADGMFDGEAVAIPSRDVRRVEAEHRARFDDDVLQRFVERMTDVDAAVRVRRPVVQHELRPAGRFFADETVDVDRLPVREPLRLVLRQIRLHRERGIREVEGLFVVGAALGHGDRGSYHSSRARA